MKVLIEVTQEDIDGGQRNSACDCPVAIALNRARDEFWIVSPDQALCVALGASELPPEAQAFVKAFDDGQPVAPFSFEIELPQDSTGEPQP